MTEAVGSEAEKKAKLEDFPQLGFVSNAGDFLEKEVSTIEETRKVPRSEFFGVAFSGGGIRSGIFCLGVMQKLAASGIFKNVDYLSTVSGGGYIGSALAWWLTGKTSTNESETENSFDAGSKLPWGTADPDDIEAEDNKILSHVRNNGNYLIPGDGINLLSGLAVVLRAVLLNLLVWIPIVAAAFIAMHWIGAHEWARSLAGELAFFGDAPQFTLLFKLCLLAAVFVGVIYVALSIQFSLLSWSRRSTKNMKPWLNVRRTKADGAGKLLWWAKLASWIMWALIAAINVYAGLQVASIIGALPGSCPDVPAVLAWTCGTVYLGVPVLVVLALACLSYSIVLSRFEYKGSAGPFVAFIGLALWLIWQSWQGLPVANEYASDPSKWVPLFALTMASVMLVNYRLGKFFRWLRQVPPASMRYSGRRSFEKGTGYLLIAEAALVAIGVIPLVHLYIYSEVGEAGGGITGLLGVLGGALSAYWGFYQSQGKGGGGKFTGPILKFGAAALLFGLATLSFDVAERVSVSAGLVQSTSDYLAKQEAKPDQNVALIANHPIIQEQVSNGDDMTALLLFGGRWQELELAAEEPDVAGADSSQSALEQNVVQAVFLGFLAIALITGFFANLNYISLGRFYRDRLVEAFMPDFETAKTKQSGAAGLADKLRLSDVWQNRNGPYPLINANIVLANSRDRKIKQRGGASFLLSPMACGSDETGWLQTSEFDGNEMTLATAMAISGAAANPRSGVGGKGITRSKTVSLVMNLLNFRLGYWVNNPCRQKTKWMKWRPNHIFPSGVYAATGSGYAETSKFSELSDGGHFENLGLYELVRRRCRLIIICDGGQDNTASYSDFVTAIRRIEDDFGAKITFNENAGPANMIAKPCDDVYPSDADYADKGYFVAEIDYCADDAHKDWSQTGLIIYLKTTMIRDLSMKAKGYKGANPDFPDQSTGDQFFDEEQFEAYRELGYRIADQMIGDLDLETDFNGGRPAFDESWKRELLKRAAASHRETGYQSTRRSRPVRLRKDQAPA
ncbi:MAG: patatin-like phospholipase family protein [Roseibium sp.]|uniref:patatin-like phospholipase family protein n=1 Tax=Roseibium sp. TaxID=1936156 RepID=UPI001B08982B|nr:patatin-like phospholipase family protein [Roseibium sp.]MBO6893960.1 patatin-like phospholipase family protein [Roseibium sp.]MBO6931934.1 patatin-like phospholipase family protein [Roseibium sp.]